MKVSPSIIAAEFLEMKKILKELEEAEANLIHLDVMDGVFVENITFGPDIAKEILSATNIPGDTHLMIIDPEKYLDRFLDTGTEYITFHIESEVEPKRFIEKVKSAGRKVGITLNPETPLSRILPYLSEVDLVLIMTVHPGFYGQKFKSEMIPRIKEVYELRAKHGYNYEIEVDGGINDKTFPLIKDYVDIVVSGGFVFKTGDIKSKIKYLKGQGF